MNDTPNAIFNRSDDHPRRPWLHRVMVVLIILLTPASLFSEESGGFRMSGSLKDGGWAAGTPEVVEAVGTQPNPGGRQADAREATVTPTEQPGRAAGWSGVGLGTGVARPATVGRTIPQRSEDLERTTVAEAAQAITLTPDHYASNDDWDQNGQPVATYATFQNSAQALIQVWTLRTNQTTQYTYDRNGNRTSLTVDGQTKTSTYYQNANGGNTSWLLSDGSWFYQYDANGNVITKAKNATVNSSDPTSFVADTTQEYWTYSWDLSNRLIEVKHNGGSPITYAYDADDHRVSRTDSNGTTVYAYGRTGALAYQKNLTINTARTFAYASGQIVGWTDTQSNGTQTKYFATTDHQGSVTQITDSSGAVVWQSEYQPFGQTAGAVGSYAFNGGYTGADVDPETGLIYLWHRWQDPSTGRFMSEDPAMDGDNWFVYGGNNPLTNSDPTGLFTQPFIGPYAPSFYNTMDYYNTSLEYSFTGASSYGPTFQSGWMTSTFNNYATQSQSYKPPVTYTPLLAYQTPVDSVIPKITSLTSTGNGVLDFAQSLGAGFYNLGVSTFNLTPWVWGSKIGLDTINAVDNGLKSVGIDTMSLGPLAPEFAAVRFETQMSLQLGRFMKDLFPFAARTNLAAKTGNMAVINRMNSMSSVLDNPNFDCSDIAGMLKKEAGGGSIINFEMPGNYNRFSQQLNLKVPEGGKIVNYTYHDVFADGRYVYDPRFSSQPILQPLYIRMMEVLNPGVKVKFEK